MQLTDLNSGRDIGANCLLVELGPFRLLLDCGLHPKKIGRAATPALARLDRAPPDYIIITHSHLDHIGSLPLAVRRAPDAPILTTPGTAVLLPRMLRNSCSVMLRQRDELGVQEYPLFTFGEIGRLEEKILALGFNRPRTLEKNGARLELTFFPAGHVAGAAGVRLVYKNRRIFFTGDVLFADQTTLAGAKFPEESFDTVVTETTRGRTSRPATATRERETARFIETVETTLGHGGSVLVPVFALGRMQEVLALLLAARRAKKLGHVPIFASGLGLDLAGIFDELTKKGSGVRFRKSILGELGVAPLREDFKPGREPARRGLYVVSSGMMVENTPSYIVAASLAAKPRHAVCFVGYCDPDTPGGRLLATPTGDKFVFGTLQYATDVHARVERFDLSGHADREELRDYALARQPRAVVLTHGDPTARDWFLEEFRRQPGGLRVVDPVPGETCEV